MPKLTIDNKPVEVSDGSTILYAARKLGLDIPTLCYRDGCDPSTSCLVCVVKIKGKENFVPACATVAEENMQVESETEEVRQARRTALELLLSDHLGDCVGPCESICPAHMNIPLMIRQIVAGKMVAAIKTVKKDIPLPAILGRICPAPCEKGCRRNEKDEGVAICLLKRYVADTDLASGNPYLPECQRDIGKRVAIVGAGPAGLAAAYYLRQAGVKCTIYDDNPLAGGMLRYGVPEEKLPREVLEAEIDTIRILGVDFILNTMVGKDISYKHLRSDYDAVLLACGEQKDKIDIEGLEVVKSGISINNNTLQTNLDDVFVAGSIVRKGRMAVRAVEGGKRAAGSIVQSLMGKEVTGIEYPFTVHMGRLQEGEIEKFMAFASIEKRVSLSIEGLEGLTDEQAKAEASRCLGCDCRKLSSCKLRSYADKYKVKAGRYKGVRREFEHNIEHPEIVFEAGKCISCGLCVQITVKAKEKLGLTFIGKGFNVRVAVPFNESIKEGLAETAGKCVEACPTGALSYREHEE